MAWIDADGSIRGGEAATLEGEVTQLVLTPDGSAAVAGTDKGNVAWIDADGSIRGGEAAKLEGGVSQLVLTPDGSAAVAGTSKGHVARVHGAGCDTVSLPTGSAVRLLPYGSQGELLALDTGASSLALLGPTTVTVGRFDSRRLLLGEWTADHRAVVLGRRLVIGTTLSNLHALDIELLMRHSVESARAVGPRAMEAAKVERWAEAYGPHAGYARGALLLVTTTTQYISVGFHPSIPWQVPAWVRELLLLARNLGLVGTVDLGSWGAQLGALALVAIFVWALHAQVLAPQFRYHPCAVWHG